jgi:hypothetical protein
MAVFCCCLCSQAATVSHYINGSAPGVWRLAPSSDIGEFLKSRREFASSALRPGSVTTFHPDMVDGVCVGGTIELLGAKRHFFVYGVGYGEKKVHHFAFDMDCDGDLAEESCVRFEVGEAEHRIALRDPTGRMVEYNVRLEKRKGLNEYTVRVFPSAWLEGRIRVGDCNARAAVVDLNNDGRIDPTDILAVDLDGDCRFACDFEEAAFGKPVIVNGRLGSFRPVGGRDVEFVPSSVPTGKIAIKHEDSGLMAGFSINLWLMSIPDDGEAPRHQMVSSRIDNFPVEMPPGHWRLMGGQLRGGDVVVPFGGKTSIHVSEGRSSTLTIAKPTFHAFTQMRDRRFHVQFRATAGDIVLWPTESMRVDMKVCSESGKELVSQKLRPACGSTYAFVADLPDSALSHPVLTVEFLIDTGRIFGKITSVCTIHNDLPRAPVQPDRAPTDRTENG